MLAGMAGRATDAHLMGDRIRKVRKVFGLTQKQLAEVCKVTPAAVGNWEQGTARPEYEQILAICERFNVTSDYILFGRVDAVPYETAKRLMEEARTG